MMNTNSVSPISRLLFIGNLSIFMIGLGFAVRANIAADLQGNIFNVLDMENSATLVGEALGITFLGFALTLLFGSALVDWMGAKAMLLLSALGYIAGSIIIGIASILPVSEAVHSLILIGLLLTGLGWGAVEAASNPMVAALEPDNKTQRLNVLHAWWPAGIVAGGLSGVLLDAMAVSWQWNLLLLILPGALLAYLVARSHFPVTERVARGVSYSEMFRELFRQPLFLVFWICMLMTAATELAPGQWVDLALSRVVGMKGILLLVYVSMLMFVMRHFAGSLAHRLSPVGLMWWSSLLAAIGLYALSMADTPLSAFAAATIWGVGVCYMYPTMLAIVNERFPRGGALFLGLMGFAAGMSIQFVLPQMGAVFDQSKLDAAGGAEQLALLSGNELDAVLRHASVESFQAVGLIPVLLLFIFAAIWLFDRARR